MKILGLSGGYHDSAAALICDGVVLAAAQEERFTRRKHEAAFPQNAAAYCLREGKVQVESVDIVAWYERPMTKFTRVAHGYCVSAPAGYKRFRQSLPAWLFDRLWIHRKIKRHIGSVRDIRFVPHHLSHASSAFFPSPFTDAAILTVDGVGEWVTNAIWEGCQNSVSQKHSINFPDSIGLLYSAATAYCGFAINDGEFKVMGLAAYGTPKYLPQLLNEVVDLRDDGSYRLNMDYFPYGAKDQMFSDRLCRLFGGPPRNQNAVMLPRFADVASSVQNLLEVTLIRQARFAKSVVPSKNICLAGGVALNCVANSKLLRDGCFERVWVQPAAGDAGGAVGAALSCAAVAGELERSTESSDSVRRVCYLGPSYSDKEIRDVLSESDCEFEQLDPAKLCRRAANELAAGRVIGWFQGRMEFGPRALGNRSILADPRDPAMQERLNSMVKHRENFRPFAPIVSLDSSNKFFDMSSPSPFMLFVANVRPQQESSARLPAITHIDGTARVQTLSPGDNPEINQVLKAFQSLTGVDVLVNTSFNDSDEPIVCSPADALATFARTRLDALVIGSFWVYQPKSNTRVAKTTCMGGNSTSGSLFGLLAEPILLSVFVLIVLPLALPLRGAFAWRRRRKCATYWLRHPVKQASGEREKNVYPLW